MSKTILAAALGLALSSALPAQLVDVNVHAGYTTFAMGDLNTANDNLLGYPMFGHSAHVENGVVAGADFTTQRLVPAGLAWGLRAEVMQSNTGEFKDAPSTYGTTYQTGVIFTDQATLSNVLLGGAYAVPLVADGLTLGVGAWIGGGHAVLNQNATMNVSNPKFRVQSGSFSADVPVAEAEGTLSYRLSSRVSVDLNDGWRWADAAQVKSGSTALVNNWQRWYRGASQPVNVDFGGITGQGSVSVSF
jgi:hypothetical protein